MQRQRAFSLIELLTVIGIIAVLAALLLVAMVSAQHRSRQTSCLNNLHQLGIGFTGFALDHEGAYPMRVPARLDGSMEFTAEELIANTAFSADFHHFLALSNQVPNFRVMTCPADHRKPAANLQAFGNTNLSYWANPDAAPHATLSLLAGDRNIISVTNAADENRVFQFDKRTHRNKGSVLFADGRVEFTRRLAYAPPTVPDATPAKVDPKPSLPAIGVASTQTPRPGLAPPSQQNPFSPADSRAKLDSNNPSETNQNRIARDRLPLNSRSVQWRPRGGGSSAPGGASEATSPGRPQTAGRIPSSAASAENAGSTQEPWDTPGFRIFKFIAIASYLVSLLWAIILLLLCYLKWRVDQRQKQQESASAFDQS